MKMQAHFTLDEVRRLNHELISGTVYDTAGLSPAGCRIVLESKFSREEINRAFAEAMRVVFG